VAPLAVAQLAVAQLAVAQPISGVGGEPVAARLDQAPYAGSTAPLMGAAASLTKNATTSAIASGVTAWASTSLGSDARAVAVLSNWERRC
jgi:hypothetical protein